MLSKQLQQIPPLVEINQYIQLLQHIKVLIQPHPLRLEPRAHRRIVRLRHLDKLDAAGLQIRNRRDDIRSAKRNVLHAGAAVEIDVLFNLALFLAVGRLVDGHLDDVVGRAHDHAFERGVLGADVLIVHTPEAVEAEHALVVGAYVVHFVPVLVADAVVYRGEVYLGEEFREGVRGGGAGGVAGEEDAGVGGFFDEGVGCVAVGFEGGEADGAVGVGEDVRGGNGFCAGGDGGSVDCVEVVDFEGDVWKC